MKRTTGFSSDWMLLALGAILAGCLLALPIQLNAQNTCSGTQGQNGVYNATYNNNAPGVVGSSAFIAAMPNWTCLRLDVLLGNGDGTGGRRQLPDLSPAEAIGRHLWLVLHLGPAKVS
jgi:hypothetical protein